MLLNSISYFRLKAITKDVQIAVGVLALMPNSEYSLNVVCNGSLKLETDSSHPC